MDLKSNVVVVLVSVILLGTTITATLSNPEINSQSIGTRVYTISQEDRDSAQIARLVLEAAYNDDYLSGELEYLANMTRGPILISTQNIPDNTRFSVPEKTFTLIDPSQIGQYFYDEAGNSRLPQGYHAVFLQFWEITVNGDDAYVTLTLSYHSGPKNGDRVIGWGGAEIHLRKLGGSWTVRIFDVRYV